MYDERSTVSQEGMDLNEIPPSMFREMYLIFMKFSAEVFHLTAIHNSARQSTKWIIIKFFIGRLPYGFTLNSVGLSRST